MEPMDWNPGSLLQVSGSYWMTCTLHAGVKLGLFTCLGKEAKTAGDLAGDLGADPDAVARLVNALCAMGLVEKKGETFSNTQAALQFLVKDSPGYLGYMILHHRQLVPSWARLDEAVETGKPVRDPVSHGDETARENFLMGMFNNAMAMAPGLVKMVDLSGRKNLLDLGGGPGAYAIHFCMENPGLSATVFDLPGSEPFFNQTVARFKMQDRIKFQGGDFTNGGIKGQYDAAWLSHILHSSGPEECLDILDKAVSALLPGGILLIHEFYLRDTLDGPLFPALFSLNMLVGTPRGRSYTHTQVGDMMEKAGLTGIQRLGYCGPTESGIMAGTKPQ